MKYSRYLLSAAILTLFFSCGKDSDSFIPNDPIEIELVGDITNFFEETLPDLEQSYSLTNEWGAEIVTPHETIIQFPPAAFVDAAGQQVPGQIDLRILELYTKGEFLLAGKPTVSDGRLLESGGEFFIEAFKDGEQVFLAPGARINLRVPDSNPRQRMELFYGEEVHVVEGLPAFNWLEADEDEETWDNVFVSEWALQDSTQGGIFGFGYECFSDSLNWINIDLFNDIPEEDRTDVCVELPEIYGNVNTIVFIVFNDINSVIALPGDPDEMQFCNFYTQFIKVGVPIGADVTFVVISEQGEDCYHFALVTATIQENHIEYIEPVKTPLDDIKQSLLNL